MIPSWRDKARALRREITALVLACRDPRTPWLARIVAACVVGYAFSPIDLIPDFIPILGYLDDLILLPLGIMLVIRLIPPQVMADSRARADEVMAQGKPVSWAAAVVIVLIWLALAVGIGWVVVRFIRR